MSIEAIVFENGLEIDNKPYSLEKITKNIKEFTIIREGCLSLLARKANQFFIYFPYTNPSELKKVSKKEYLEIKKRHKKDSLTKWPLLDRNVDDIVYVDIDCLGNVWVLNKKKELYQFLNSGIYKKTKQRKFIFKEESEPDPLTGEKKLIKHRWTNLYIDCKVPLDTSINIKITCNNKTEIYKNSSNIYLYDFEGDKLEVEVFLETNDEVLSPVIYSIRVDVDKSSYIEYLPSYYKSVDPLSLETLYRYLAMHQNIMESFENDIEKSYELLSPSLCDSNYLDWLSNLIGLSRDYRWEESKWREFLAEVPRLYKGLGTKKTMEEAIKLYCGERPIINDNMENKPFDFCVKLSSEKTERKEDIEVIESIIWAFKPAYTVGRLFIDHGLDKNKEYIVGKSVLPFHTEIK